MKINHFAMASIATLLVGSSLVAQTTSPPPSRGIQPQPGQGQDGSAEWTKDQAFAKCLAIVNQEQVLIAQFAKGKVTHSDVKQFAATLEKEHQSCVEKLKGLSTQYSNRSDVPANRSASANGNAATATFTKSANSAGVDFLQLQQEMADQCLVDSKAMLNKKKGLEIDKCFVGMQVAKHAGMQTSLTVLQRHTTGELQSMIKEGLATNAKHMEVAVALMEKLAESDSSRDSQ